MLFLPFRLPKICQASLRISKVEEKLSKGWGGENAYHVSGYRYLLVDGDRYVSRASPTGKVATLSKVSFLPLLLNCENMFLFLFSLRGSIRKIKRILELSCLLDLYFTWVGFGRLLLLAFGQNLVSGY